MRLLRLASLCILFITCGYYGTSYGDEIDDIRAEYEKYGLKVPSRSMFGTSHPSRYFSDDDIGNSNNGYSYFLANTAFWFVLDEFRGSTGPIILSSGYRNPEYNRNLKDKDGKRIASNTSLHQYGGATDIYSINGVTWGNMSDAQKWDAIVELGVVATTMQGIYGQDMYIEAVEKSDHLHLELMNYCDFDDNWT